MAPDDPETPAPEAAATGEDGRATHTAPAERLRRARAYATDAKARVESSRPKHRSLDVAFSVGEHDRMVGGGLLAGALAFRLFLWLLPAALVVVGGLGFFSGSRVHDAASHSKLRAATIEAIDTATREAHRGRWVALLLGLFFLCTASVALAKTVVAATAFAWRIPVPVIVNKPRAALLTAGFFVVAGFCSALSTWLRARSEGLGLSVTLLLVVLWGAMWWGASAMLPRPSDVGWRQLWPGALMVGIGMQAMHLITIFYLARKAESATGLYGGLGAAATIILSAYLLARLVVASCALNATLAGRRPSKAGSELTLPG